MLIHFRREVRRALESALSEMDLPTDDLGIEEPPDDVDAVLASSVAYRLAGELGAPPPSVAADVADHIDASDYDYVGDVVTQGPYVNFLPADRYFAETVERAGEESFGQLDDRDVSVVLEHTSANPTGPIHVGRARNPIIGDALRRVLEFAGYDVDTHYYVNDAGRQVAILTWAYETFDESDLPPPEREGADYDLVRYYRKGNAFLESASEEEVEAAEAEIDRIIEGLEAGDEAVYERTSAIVDRMIDGMRQTLDRLPVTFDEFVKETRFLRNGAAQDVVERLKDLDEAVYEDGAWQLDFDGIDKNFVFLRSDGTTLYATRDLAHHEWKFDNYDRATTVLGEGHKLQVEHLRAALERLGNDTDQLSHVIHSWVSLPGGEGMSTRKGTGIDLEDLLDEAVDRARQEVRDRMDDRIRDDDLTEEDVERIARQVGIGAVRYDIVAKQPTKAITFEWDRALDFEAQSAPYVQYVHARACGILDRANGTPAVGEVDPDVLSTPEERDLLKTIARFPATVETAAEELEPHRIATYTRTFAERFNAFYRECPVLGDDVDPEVRTARLALVVASRHTIGNALSLLGVEAPDSM